MFALPVVLIASSRKPAVIPAALPAIDDVRALLEQHGAVGATRNFGLGSGLVAAEALERITPSTLYRWHADWQHGAPRDLPPQEIAVRPGREEVHLRFLAGAGIAAADAPSFVETAAHIGGWGLPVTRELARQLALPGLDLLALPRPPADLLRAAHAGRSAALDVAFNVFASNAVRTFRATVGDPVVALSAHRLGSGGGEIRVSLSSPLDDTLLDGFRWPLHPLDELDRIVDTVVELFEDCRVTDVRIVDSLQPDRLPSGGFFLRGAELDVLPDARH